MRISSQVKRLKERIKKEKKYPQDGIVLPDEVLQIEVLKEPKTKEKVSINLIRECEFFKRLLRLIQKGATGFDLAYEVEKNHYVKNLISDGVLFYNTFLEIGTQKFINQPDVRKVDYSNFKTIEQTEKQLFLMWIKEEIEKREKILKDSEKYEEYIKNRENIIQKYLFCENCGAKIKDRYQQYCEKCGFKFVK